MNSPMQRVVKEVLRFNGRDLAEVIVYQERGNGFRDAQGHFRRRNVTEPEIIPLAGRGEVTDLAESLSARGLIHLEDEEPGLFRTLDIYGINPERMITADSLGIYLMERGYLNRGSGAFEDLARREPLVAKVVERKGWKDHFFEDFFSDDPTDHQTAA